jgi:hypothetical protein
MGSRGKLESRNSQRRESREMATQQLATEQVRELSRQRDKNTKSVYVKPPKNV